MSTATSSKPGRLLAERYRLARPLARGAMGELWVARDETLERPVAIKLIGSGLAEDPSTRLRFLREAKAAARLKSPHVVSVFDHGDDDGVSYIVMELLEGEDLKSRLSRMGRCPLANAVWVAEQVSKGLTEAHEAGVVHRDLKPANLFLARSVGEDIVKILDFGIARLAGFDGATTMTGELVGSPFYMSPEQALGTAEIDHRSDLFAFGTILYNALSSTQPFEASSLALVLDRIRAATFAPMTEVAPELPHALDAFFAKAMARDRETRFDTAQEMAAAFGEACGVEALPFEVNTAGSGDTASPTEASTKVKRRAWDGTEVLVAPDSSEGGSRTHRGVSRSVPATQGAPSEPSPGWWARPPQRGQRRRIVLATVGATAFVGLAFVVAASQLGEHEQKVSGTTDRPSPAAVQAPPEPIDDARPPEPIDDALEKVEQVHDEVESEVEKAPTATNAAEAPAARWPKPNPVALPSPPPPEPPPPASPQPPSEKSPRRLKLGY